MVPSSRNCVLLLSFLLVIFPWSTVASVDLSFLGVSSDLTGAVDIGSGTNGLDKSSTISSVAQPPPPHQCWIQALKIFQPKNEYEMETTSKVCEQMAPQHQKALAFELARCHLQDLGRKMLETVVGGEHIDDPQDCTALVYDNGDDGDDYEKESSFPNLPQCLSGLTDAGVNAYTHFFAQVVALCNRLTQHLAIGFQQQTAMELAKISHQTVEQFTSIIQRQQDAFHEREEEMRQRHDDFYAALKEHQESLREEESSRFEAFQEWTSSLLSSWKQHDQQQKDRNDAWIGNITSLWESQSAKFDQYQKKLSIASNFMQPILSLDTWIKLANFGWRLLAITFHFLLLVVGASVVTRPRRCRRVRGILFLFIMLETLAELCIYFLMDDLVSGDQKQAMIDSLRPTTLCVETLVWAANLVISCCCCDFGWLVTHNALEDDDLDGDELSVARAQRREDMRSEFRLLLTETGNHRSEPLPLTLPPVASATAATPDALGAPPGPASYTHLTSSRVPPSPQPATTAPVARAAPATSRATGPGTQATTTTHIFRTSTAAQILGMTEAGTPNVVSGNSGASEASIRHLTSSSNEEQETQDVIPAGKAKKRSSEEIHSSDDNDSDVSVDNGSSSPSLSPNKRRRTVESVEKTTATASKSVPMEENYHTATEEDQHQNDFEAEHSESQSTDEEDSTMVEEDEDEDVGKAKEETMMEEDDSVIVVGEDEEETKMEES